MLYVCIPVHNEAATIGVLLWRIRTVLQEYARDYEVVVYDDGSTDETPDVLDPYRKVLPLTVLRGERRLGTAAAVDALCRHVVGHTRYPRRDGAVLMQGDFTDRPEDLLELARRFEGGADLIVGRRAASGSQPEGERRLRQWAPRVLRLFLRIPAVDDLVTSYRLVRVSVLRDAARARGEGPLSQGAGWTALVDFVLAVTPYARRVEMVDLPGRYDLRPRASRLDWWSELRALASYAWRARGRRIAAGERVGDRLQRAERPERAERVAERAAEPSPESALERSIAADRPDRAERPARATRERRPSERPARAGSERPGERSGERPPLARGADVETTRGRRREREPDRSAAPERAPRPPRPERAPASEAERPAPTHRARRSERALDGSSAPEFDGEQEATRPAPRPRRERSPGRSPERLPVDAPVTTGLRAATTDAADATEAFDTATAIPLGSSDGSVLPETTEMQMPGAEGAPRKRARRRRRRGSRVEGAVGGEGEALTGEAPEADGQPTTSAEVRTRRESVEPFGDVSDATGDLEGTQDSEGELGEGDGAGGGTRRRRRRRRSRGERASGAASGSEGEAQASSGTDGRDGVALHQVEMHEPVERAVPPDRATD